MINYSTFYSMVKSIILLAVFQISSTHFVFSQQCAPSISIACNAGYLSVNGDFGGTIDCPASLTINDGAEDIIVPISGGCKSANESYLFFGNPAPFDCGATSITIDIGTEVCEYDTPDGLNATVSLPVELGIFSAKNDNGKITLKWLTYTELNNDYFSIERSNDGINFEVIAEESGAGTTFEESRYSFTDNEPTDGINYYRLSQTDFDGAYEAFPVLSVDMESLNNDQLRLFPNPTSGFVNLAFSEVLLEKQTTINLYDLSGKLVQSQELFLEDTIVRLDLDNVPQGMYFITAQAGREFLRKKLSIY